MCVKLGILKYALITLRLHFTFPHFVLHHQQTPGYFMGLYLIYGIIIYVEGKRCIVFYFPLCKWLNLSFFQSPWRNQTFSSDVPEPFPTDSSVCFSFPLNEQRLFLRVFSGPNRTGLFLWTLILPHHRTAHHSQQTPVTILGTFWHN